MPKRIGYVWEEVVSLENCEQAVLDAIRHKKKTRYLEYVKRNYKKYGAKVQRLLLEGWEPKPVRLKTIHEGTNKKPRNLKIPALIDHFVHTAVARILKKYLQPKFYFYASGSLPNRGQIFSKNAVEHMLKSNPQYAAEADIKKCYDNIKSEVVMQALERIFKDRKFLDINRKIIAHMGGNLAIGFTLSHWYAHLVLMKIDYAVKMQFPGIQLTRSMDNFVLVSDSKNELHEAIRYMQKQLESLHLRLKEDWQVFQVSARPIAFLSYRHQSGKTILKKPLLYRIAKRLRRMKPCARTARIVMSYLGILKHCASYNFRRRCVYPYVNIERCRRLISNADKKRILCGTA